PVRFKRGMKSDFRKEGAPRILRLIFGKARGELDLAGFRPVRGAACLVLTGRVPREHDGSERSSQPVRRVERQAEKIVQGRPARIVDRLSHRDPRTEVVQGIRPIQRTDLEILVCKLMLGQKRGEYEDWVIAASPRL